MYPETLKLQAFGPYVDEQCIAFHALASSHVFLIRGETGSGKTVLLDAITFALYGKSSGGQRDNFEQMRSRFADDTLATYVDFTFQVKGHHYRFYRSLEVRYNRNQEKQLKMRLDAGEYVDGEYIPFFENPKIRLIEEQANALIGLQYEQFVQVMVLPQGKFEQFLTSHSEEKQAILKSLFQMERYGNVMEHLYAQMKCLRDEVEQIKQQKVLLLKQLGVKDMEELAQVQTKMMKKKQEEETSLQQVLVMEDTLQKQMAQYARYCAWEQDEKRYRKQCEALEAQTKDVEKMRISLTQYHKVKDLANEAYYVKQANEEMQRREKIKQEISIKLQEHACAYAKIAQWQLELQTEKNELNTLQDAWKLCESLQPIYARYEELQKDEQAMRKTFATMHANIQTLQQQEAEKQRLYQHYHEEYHSLQEVLDTNIELEAQWQTYTKAYEVYKTLQTMKQQSIETHQLYTQECEAYTVAKKHCTHLHEEHEHYYQLFLENSAMMLSASLQENTPCPVCGSTSHPNPALQHAVEVDLPLLRKKKQIYDMQKKKVEEIREKCQKTEAIYDQLMQHQQRYEQEILTLLQQSFQIEHYTKLEKEIGMYEAKKKRQITLMQQLEQLRKEMAQLQSDQQALQQRFLQAQQSSMRIQVERDSCKQRFMQDIETLLVLQEYQNTLSQKMQQSKQLATSWEQRITSTHLEYEKTKQHTQQAEIEYTQALHRYQRVKDQLETNMQKQHIIASDLNVLKDLQRIEEIQQSVQKYDEEMVKIHALLKEHAQQKQDIIEIDKAVLDENVKMCKEQKAQYQNSVTFLQLELKRYAQNAKELQSMDDILQTKEPYMLKMGNFVRLVRGDNGIGLERYVLGVMLSQITQHANTLLKNVHYGRYQLYRSDIGVGRTRKHGLELEIYDAYTCSRRNVVSLSGGEKFLVSLALSLALSLVVQMRNGGVRLDAMFIDEGFGTLDEHSIADALSILQTMVSTKGMVGIISHVEVLKENIPQGIEVIKTKKGSYVNIRKGDV